MTPIEIHINQPQLSHDANRRIKRQVNTYIHLQINNGIMHNQYLAYCYDSICEAEGSLVTFGPYDEHVIEGIK